MKVLHVITGLGIGGAEQQLRLLLNRLPTQSAVVTLTNPGAVARGIVADGFPVTDLDIRGNRDIGALPRLTGLIKDGRYDLVHTHLYRACVYGRLAARLAGVRTVVATEHSLGATQIEGRSLTVGARVLYLGSERLGTETVAVSTTVANRLRRWGVRRDRIHVVPNGIDVPRFSYDETARHKARAELGLPADAFVVGGIGRLSEGKRFDTLVRAVAALPGARLLLVGEGPERDRLLDLAAELGAGDRVLLHGACEDPPPKPPDGTGPDLPSLLAAMDLFVSTSADEAFGLAVIEGLAAGLPVLYVTCPALTDLPPDAAPGARRITGSVDGLVAELVAAQGRLAAGDGPPRLPAPPAARHYDISRSAEQLMSVYDRALRRTGSSEPAVRRPATPEE
ncbi:D-inositol 3-phosphate glycosyltransferase [Streptomyces sp. S4.7]|uniref:glycosyltransferase n=1 Tax=Streptomyces sp. S4.7 TaxID=2705439 RepID=UPI0013972A70|nr:glycosyltransferase [Streptomyces sp. S4.7]QHY96086.1 D-inositol 3-phosphate glycosyltransferase [Streptomyces sp. S4.7]